MIKSSVFVIVLFSIFQLSSAQWTEQVSPVSTALFSVSAVDNNVVWACSNSGAVVKTTNGGTNWISVMPPSAGLNLFSIWGVDANIALVTGSSADTYVYRTSDGGTTWTQVFMQISGFIDAMAQNDYNNNKIIMIGDALGGRWSLWQSTNAGSSWDSTGLYLAQAGGNEWSYPNDMAVVITNLTARLWFGTGNTRVYYTSGPPMWTSQPTPGLTSSQSIWFNDSARGMVGGTILLSTVNSGTLWAPVAGAPGSGLILGITGAGNDWWYTRGSSVYYSSNNGITWVTDYTAPSGSFFHISRSRTGSSMWAVRSNGGISRSLGPIGIQPISNEIPVNYVLHQNYPNPFNPSTSIKFELPKSSSVELVIYDALGREAATLVDENLKAGVYEVSWDAGSYSSGAYFYKLTAGDFTDTKRMVLIK